ncbi:MAG: DUF2130 domain-containing protein [Bacillales bacterium]
MKTLKVRIEDKTVLVLEEEGHIGDKIDLKNLESIDDSFINKAIENKKDEIYQNKLNENNKLLETEYKLNLQKEIKSKEKEVLDYKNKFESIQSKYNDLENLKNKEIENLKESIKNQYILEISNLKTEIDSINNNIKLNEEKTILELENKYNDLIHKNENEYNNNINKLKDENNNNIKSLEQEVEKYKNTLSLKEDEIKQIKEYKQKLSTKNIGESLEKFCENEFNLIRSFSFPNAIFEKDTKAINNSKGDFIYRDFDEVGNEITSIMFEMKNESEETEKKQKNDKFFKKLDNDRTNNKCEYAVLVTTLEEDNELYNQGILDISHKYKKMYVIRPQFFIPIIGLIKNASLNSLESRLELEEYKNQSIDLVNFQNNLNTFKDVFGKNFKNANDRFNDAIKEIDKSIDALTKVKNNLTTSLKHLNAANNHCDELQIKKLTKNAPSIKQYFDNLNNNNNNNNNN